MTQGLIFHIKSENRDKTLDQLKKICGQKQELIYDELLSKRHLNSFSNINALSDFGNRGGADY